MSSRNCLWAMFAALLAVAPQVCVAMPAIGGEGALSRVLDAQITEQNAAFIAGDFAKAYKLNRNLEKPIRKVSGERPELLSALLVDRAIFLDRLGKRPQALKLLDEQYARNGFQPLLTNYNADYFTYAAERYYATWLSEIDNARAEKVREAIVEKILKADTSRQTLYAMQYPVSSIDRRRKAGDVEYASAKCREIFAWLEGANVSRYGILQSYHGTIMVDESGDFVTDLAFRSGPHDQFLQYLTADTNDSCAAVNEYTGNLDLAVAQRLRSRDAIVKSDQPSFARVIELRLARLYGFANMPNIARYHLEQAWQAYTKDMGRLSAQGQLCRDLKFYYDGSDMLFAINKVVISPSDVWQRLADTPSLYDKPLEFECAD